jgi:spore coat polysaccharide biosynthesis protein SpsF
MKTVALIQARMGSSRLPRKVLLEIDGIPLLKIMMDRVITSERIDEIIIATTEQVEDNAIEEFCESFGYKCFRGAENDVLDRYYQAAKKYNANVIVRLTSDCPLIDSRIIDETIELFNKSNCDYAANCVPPESKRFPDGSDVEVFSYECLEEIWREAKDPKDREHVTHYFWRGKRVFDTQILGNDKNWRNYRITIDYPEDYEVIKFVVQELKRKKIVGSLSDVIDILDSNPQIKKLNSSHYSGEGW